MGYIFTPLNPIKAPNITINFRKASIELVNIDFISSIKIKDI
jgi:hypothetical protein